MAQGNEATTRPEEVTAGIGEDPGDSGYGWVMFVTFTASVLGISLAVGVLALAPSWWMLGLVYGVDLIVTAVVFKVVLGAFASPAYLEPAATQRVETAALPEPVAA